VGYAPTPHNLFEKRLTKNFFCPKFLKGAENFLQKVFCGFDLMFYNKQGTFT